jgi:hypothetical protein
VVFGATKESAGITFTQILLPLLLNQDNLDGLLARRSRRTGARGPPLSL